MNNEKESAGDCSHLQNLSKAPSGVPCQDGEIILTDEQIKPLAEIQEGLDQGLWPPW